MLVSCGNFIEGLRKFNREFIKERSERDMQSLLVLRDGLRKLEPLTVPHISLYTTLHYRPPQAVDDYCVVVDIPLLAM